MAVPLNHLVISLFSHCHFWNTTDYKLNSVLWSLYRVTINISYRNRFTSSATDEYHQGSNIGHEAECQGKVYGEWEELGNICSTKKAPLHPGNLKILDCSLSTFMMVRKNGKKDSLTHLIPDLQDAYVCLGFTAELRRVIKDSKVSSLSVLTKQVRCFLEILILLIWTSYWCFYPPNTQRINKRSKKSRANICFRFSVLSSVQTIERNAFPRP